MKIFNKDLKECDVKDKKTGRPKFYACWMILYIDYILLEYFHACWMILYIGTTLTIALNKVESEEYNKWLNSKI